MSQWKWAEIGVLKVILGNEENIPRWEKQIIYASEVHKQQHHNTYTSLR